VHAFSSLEIFILHASALPCDPLHVWTSGAWIPRHQPYPTADFFVFTTDFLSSASSSRLSLLDFFQVVFIFYSRRPGFLQIHHRAFHSPPELLQPARPPSSCRTELIARSCAPASSSSSARCPSAQLCLRAARSELPVPWRQPQFTALGLPSCRESRLESPWPQASGAARVPLSWSCASCVFFPELGRRALCARLCSSGCAPGSLLSSASISL
jgi:hypothetical protein